MGDIIKAQSDLFSNIYLDHKLFALPVQVPKLETREDVAKFLMATARVNNLIITNEGSLIFVQAPDIPEVKILESGELSEAFMKGASNFGWDILELNGSYIVEYPRGHDKIFEQVQKSLILPVEFEISIVSLISDELKERGISLQTAFSINENLFDLVRDGLQTSSDGLVLQAVAGVSPEDFKQVFSRSTVLKCSGLIGEEIVVKVVQEYPYQLQGFDQLGKLTRQDVEVFEAGLTITLRPYVLKEEVRVKCDVQISNIDGINDFGYPNITRRSTLTSAILGVDESQIIAQLKILEDSNSEKRTFRIFKRDKSSDQVRTVLVTVRRTK